MNKIKNNIKKLIQKTGYDVVKIRNKIGQDPHADMNFFLDGLLTPTILDIGANRGQSVDKFLSIFPTATLHSFEPSPKTYAKLLEHCKKFPNVYTWNKGVGSVSGRFPFIENEHSDMSSFLDPSTFSWGKVTKKTEVPVTTIDEFAQENKIDFIHILKSDAQGYDLEVFNGASQLMKQNKIALIYFEFIFSDMYKNLPSFDVVFKKMLDNNFSLISFYDLYYQNNMASWLDMLFINKEFLKNKRQD